MTRRQYVTIMAALTVVLLVSLAASAVGLLAARSSCERGNVTRAHLARPAAPANCSLLGPVQ